VLRDDRAVSNWSTDRRLSGRGNRRAWASAAAIALGTVAASAQSQSPDTMGRSVITAARTGDHAALRGAINAGVKLEGLRDEHDQTPLDLAIGRSDPEAVGMLLKAGAPCNDVGPQGHARPPLSAALLLNDPNTVSLLLDAGARVAFRDSFGCTMFGIAFAPGNGAKDAVAQEQVLVLLFNSMTARGQAYSRVSPKETIRCIDQALCEAARAGSISWCRKLLNAGANPDAIELRMYTPLMGAAIAGSEDAVNLLLEADADPHIALGARTTALAYAVSGKPKAGVVRLLLTRYGPNDPELNDYASGSSAALARAVNTGDGPVLSLLIGAGADPMILQQHIDLLAIAIRAGRPESVEVLLKAGVKPGPLLSLPTRTHLELARDVLSQENTPERRRVMELLENSPSKPP
jgi:ankyrin repeat protein